MEPDACDQHIFAVMCVDIPGMRGIAGMVFLLGSGGDFSGRVLDPAGRRENVGMKYSSSCGCRFFKPSFPETP